MKSPKSFARRIGRKLSERQQSLINNELPKYAVDFDELLGQDVIANSSKITAVDCFDNLRKGINNTCAKILEKINCQNKAAKSYILEIGFGSGDHLLYQAIQNPQTSFIGAEVYLNSVVKVIDKMLSGKIENIAIYPDDVNILIDQMPNESLTGVYILFPDPWPKKRHTKRRMINPQFLSKLHKVLKSRGFLIFASDILDYYQDVLNLLLENSGWIQNEKDAQLKCTTKYYSKAIKEGRKMNLLCFNKA